MICGPPNSGKSTLARYLTNRLLSFVRQKNGIAYLDLDPGQPEYSLPGNLTLSQIKHFNFGPPYTHAFIEHNFLSKDEDIVEMFSQHYGYFSPRDARDEYIACALDLFKAYDNLRQRCPLIINCCGWFQGYGGSIIDTLIRSIKPDYVLLLQKPGYEDVNNTVKLAASYVGSCLREFDTSTVVSSSRRTAAELRDMQQCSYFHSDGFENGMYKWTANLLMQQSCDKLVHADEIPMFYENEPIIAGVILSGNEINFDMLKMTIEDTILSLVYITDEAVIDDSSYSRNYAFDHSASHSNDSIVIMDGMNKWVRKRNVDNIPYFTTESGCNPQLNLSRTRCLGQVFLREVTSEYFGVHSKIDKRFIASITSRGGFLLLIRGEIGQPEWAYKEVYWEGVWAQRVNEKWKKLKREHDIKTDSSSEEEADENWIQDLADRTDYLEYVTNDDSRKLNRIRKIRRNLI
jgi:polynucleotide 5'-hydroxyl-kinase GRC3/NOL9